LRGAKPSKKCEPEKNKGRKAESGDYVSFIEKRQINIITAKGEYRTGLEHSSARGKCAGGVTGGKLEVHETNFGK